MRVIIINYNRPIVNHLSILYIHADPNNDNKEKEEKETKTTKATEIMSSPLITVERDTYLYDLAKKMVKNKIRRLPVVKDNKLVGIVTVGSKCFI